MHNTQLLLFFFFLGHFTIYTGYIILIPRAGISSPIVFNLGGKYMLMWIGQNTLLESNKGHVAALPILLAKKEGDYFCAF